MLDLFAGSGALGLEALSRGAAEATFVDSAAAAVAAVRANLEALGGEAEVRRADALRFLRAAPGEARHYDLVLLDPPYRLAERLGRELSEALPAVLAPAALVVSESDRRAPLPSTCPSKTNAATATPSSASMAPDNRIAVCPGSYDPITNGHIDVISRASVMFDELIVAVVNASVRKNKGAVQRRGARASSSRTRRAHLGNVRVDTFGVLIVDYARSVGAKAIVKGLRAISDFEYELEMNQLNRHLAADVESVYLMASPQYSFLSSSGVKEIATFGGDVSDLVPEEVAARLQEALAR